MEVLELEGTAIWSPLVLHTTLRSLSRDSQDRVYSSGVTSERAINQPLRLVPLHNCSSLFFPDIYHSSSLLHFTSTTFFLPLFTNERDFGPFTPWDKGTYRNSSPGNSVPMGVKEQNKEFRDVSGPLEYANAV